MHCRGCARSAISSLASRVKETRNEASALAPCADDRDACIRGNHRHRKRQGRHHRPRRTHRERHRPYPRRTHRLGRIERRRPSGRARRRCRRRLGDARPFRRLLARGHRRGRCGLGHQRHPGQRCALRRGDRHRARGKPAHHRHRRHPHRRRDTRRGDAGCG